MFFSPRATASRKPSFLLPWVLVVAIAAVAVLRAGLWPHDVRNRTTAEGDVLARSLPGRHRVEVVQVSDGDTFLARIRIDGGREAVTRVRLRGIDTAEMEAQCAAERQLAERARSALRALLREGDVAITNVGSDRYGRLLADVSTRTSMNITEVMLRSGHGRRYDGGHRDGWCAKPD
jgi:endonuclease YncB( thermonuclease family)